MAPINVKFPSAEEEERARRFRVLQFYIVNICTYLEDNLNCSPESMAARLNRKQRALPGFNKVNRKVLTDEDSLKKYLYLSWASEIQLRLGVLTDPFMLKYTNCWAPVHAYYAVYMLVQAWFLSMGEGCLPDNHTDTLKMISNQLKQRVLFPQPWNVLCTGCPQLDEVCYLHIPDGVNPERHVEQDFKR